MFMSTTTPNPSSGRSTIPEAKVACEPVCSSITGTSYGRSPAPLLNEPAFHSGDDHHPQP